MCFSRSSALVRICHPFRGSSVVLTAYLQIFPPEIFLSREPEMGTRGL